MKAKLNQFKAGEEIRTWLPTDLEMAKYLKNIVKLYGKDIEWQSSTRNLIDHVFDQTQQVYSIQLAFFFTCFLVPFLIQIFIEDDTGVKVCLFICLATQIVFMIISGLQLAFMRMEFF